MSEWSAPESTRYPECPDPGAGWRQRMERWLLQRPMRYRHLWLRWELAGLKANTRDRSVSKETLREEFRRRGINSDTLSLWYSSAMERGAEKDVLAGALALIRNMAVQCDKPPLNEEMIAFACEAITLSGQSVHVLTRDDTSTLELVPVLQTHLDEIGRKSTFILSDTPIAERRTAYRAGVTILSAREALRDYLSDRLYLPRQEGEISRKLLRLTGQDLLQNTRMCGLPFGIITDANQILIDQACEPFTIGGRTDPVVENAWAETALAFAGELEQGFHFTVDDGQRVTLSDAGLSKLKQLAINMQGIWRNEYRRNHDVILALRALMMEHGRHYRIVDQRVELKQGIPRTEGLVQLLEARESVPVSGRVIPRGKLTFQRFFRRYQSLAAVCTDARYIQDELWQIYGLAGFIVTPSSLISVPDEGMLSETDFKIIDAISRVNKWMGHITRRLLTAFRIWRQRKLAQRLRYDLFRHDNQVGKVTAFSGHPE